MTPKVCTRCGVEKPPEEFRFKHSATNTRQSRCRECQNEANRAAKRRVQGAAETKEFVFDPFLEAFSAKYARPANVAAKYTTSGIRFGAAPYGIRDGEYFSSGGLSTRPPHPTLFGNPTCAPTLSV